MNKEELFSLKVKSIDKVCEQAAKNRWDAISKPLDGFGDFETLIARICGILGEVEITKYKKAVTIMCADNGIVEEGVSQCGQENTYLVTKLLGEGKSSANIMANYVNADTVTLDVGVNRKDTPPGVRKHKIAYGTRNFLKEPAMTEEECIRAIEVGILLVKELKEKGYHLIATGEMGIGNTTTGTALLCALTGADVQQVTGRGAGLSDEGLCRKKQVICDGLKKYELYSKASDKEYAFRALCCVGGFDIAALAGVYIGGALYGMPIIIDGVISAVAALVAECIVNRCKEYMIPSHSGREAGVELALQHLKLASMLNGNMALGEGTGAIMMMQLLDMMLDYFCCASTFEDGDIKQYERGLNG